MRPTTTKQNQDTSRFWASNRDWQEGNQEKYPIPPEISNWPSLIKPVSCSLPPIVLNSLRSLSILKKEPLWLVKDGLFGLISFFQRFQTPPENFSSKLIIHVKWNEIIPKAWRAYCLSFHLGPVNNFFSPFPGFTAPEPEKIIITGFLHEDYCSLVHLENKLQLYSKRSHVRELLKNGEILWVRDQHSISNKFAVEFTSTLRKYCKGKIEFRDLGGTFISGTLSSGMLIDLNERLICSDDSPTNAILSRGARIPKIYKTPKRAQMAQRSPFHAVFFYDPAYAVDSFLDSADFKELKHYLEVSQGSDTTFGLSLGVYSEWIRRLHCFKEKLSSVL